MTHAPIVIIGPSGAGKSTIANRLLARHSSLTLVRTITTRPQRSADDTTHRFVDDTTYDTMLAQGEFIGTLDAFGYHYGLPRLPADDHTPLLLLRVPVIPQFLATYPDAFVIQCEAPLDVLKQRLLERGDQDERFDPSTLQAEMNAGRKVARLIIDSTSPVDECVTLIEKHLPHE